MWHQKHIEVIAFLQNSIIAETHMPTACFAENTYEHVSWNSITPQSWA